MKSKTLIILVVLSLLQIQANSRETKMIIIHHVPFNIATPADVSCDQFLQRFGDMVKSDTITDDSIIQKIDSLIYKLQKDSTITGLDVRLRMELIDKDGSIDVLCSSGYYYEFNGYRMYPSDVLMNEITRTYNNPKNNSKRSKY
jgi:hypothetical protein